MIKSGGNNHWEAICFRSFSLIIGVYLIYAAIVGRGKLYENEYLNCPREQYVKGLRILAAISGVLLTVSNLLEYLGVIAYGSPIAIALWALGFASLIVMMVYSSKKTDRKAAAAGHKTAASAEKKDYDPLLAPPSCSTMMRTYPKRKKNKKSL